MYNNASNTDAGLQMTLVFKRRLLNAILTAKFHNVKFFTTRKKSFNFKPNCERESNKVIRFPVEHYVYNSTNKSSYHTELSFFIQILLKTILFAKILCFAQHLNPGC